MERGNSPGLVVAHVHPSFPISTRHFPCPHIVFCVCALFPMSAHCCLRPHVFALVPTLLPMSACRYPCPHVVAHVCASLRVSACHCPHPCMFVGGCFCSWVWVVAFVGGRSSSFVGNGSVVVGSHWWVVVSPRGWRSHLVAWPSWCQAVHVTVVMSLSGCHVASLYFKLPHRFHMDSTWSSLILSCLVASAHIFDTLYKTHVTS